MSGRRYFHHNLSSEQENKRDEVEGRTERRERFDRLRSERLREDVRRSPLSDSSGNHQHSESQRGLKRRANSGGNVKQPDRYSNLRRSPRKHPQSTGNNKWQSNSKNVQSSACNNQSDDDNDFPDLHSQPTKVPKVGNLLVNLVHHYRESVNNDSEHCFSRSSHDWASQVDEYERTHREAQREVNRLKYKRKLNMDQNTSQCSDSSDKSDKKEQELETDEMILLRRQKQVEYGKQTSGYIRYSKLVKKKERSRHHPRTPNKFLQYSRRSWDMQVKIWRRQLHIWDPPITDKSDVNSEVNSEASFEVSNTQMEIESSLESVHQPDVSTPQLSQEDEEVNLQENFMTIGLSPVKKRSGHHSSEEETDYIDIDVENEALDGQL